MRFHRQAADLINMLDYGLSRMELEKRCSEVIVDLPVLLMVSQSHSTRVFLGGRSPVSGYLHTNQ